MPPFLANRDFNCFYKGKVLAVPITSQTLPKYLSNKFVSVRLMSLLHNLGGNIVLSAGAKGILTYFVLVDLDFNNVLAAD